MCVGMVMLTYMFLRYLQQFDRETIKQEVADREVRGAEAVVGGNCSIITQGCLCVLGSEAVYGFCDLQAAQSPTAMHTFLPILLLAAFTGCMVAACIMDLECCMIYNYVWWIGGVVGIAFLCLRVPNVKELLVYVLLQETLFAGMYGRADCHAFVVCAMVEAAYGMGMREYLIHMLLAFGLLAVVQGVRRNIGKDGNLKQPVAFLPYITVSFWVIMFLYVFLKDFLVYLFIHY